MKRSRMIREKRESKEKRKRRMGLKERERIGD